MKNERKRLILFLFKEQDIKTKLKQDKSFFFNFSLFLNVYLFFVCCILCVCVK